VEDGCRSTALPVKSQPSLCLSSIPFILWPAGIATAAYCGISDDGKKLFAIVFQVGRRKPVLKNSLGDAGGDDAPDSECPAPVWERRPVRVTLEPDENQKSNYSVRGHPADLVNGDERRKKRPS
jgi:hypothetical protein